MNEWTAEHQAKAKAEGWQLIWVVDSGKPIRKRYLQIFPIHAQTKRETMVRLIMEAARNRSPFHTLALQLCAATKIKAGR